MTETKLGSIRDGFGQAMVELGQTRPEIVALCADLTESLRLHDFKNSFPEKFIQVGVAEQNLAGVAAGLALAGKHPFAASYAAFSPGNNFGGIRTSICYSNLAVTLVGGHAGLSAGPDGATHQALEDLALATVLPNMTVVVPADQAESYQATLALASLSTPSYLRLSREKSAHITQPEAFKIGKGQILFRSRQPNTLKVVIFACGLMVAESLQAATVLEDKSISVTVVNMATIKPIDSELVVELATQNDLILTAEEHQLLGGLGTAVLHTLAGSTHPPVLQIAVKDTFGESGSKQELFKKFGLDATAIVEKVLGAS